jgi:prophage regulatory protein
MNSSFITFDNLHERGIRFSRQHLHRLIRQGKFPRPVKLSGSPNGRNAWDEETIDRWCEDRKAEARKN